MRPTLAWAIVITASLAAPLAFAATAPELPLSTDALDTGELKVGLGGSYLSTTSNFDRFGNRQSLPGSAPSFRSIQGDLFLQYGATSDLTALLNVPYVSNAATGPAVGATGAVNGLTATGAGDLTGGLRFQTSVTPVRTSFDATVQYPLYGRLQRDDWARLKPAGPVPIGTGVTELSLFGRISYPLGDDLALAGGAGFTARTGGFSNLLPYEAFLKYEEKRGLFARVGVRGFATISDDEFANFDQTALPNERQTAAEAGSQLFNAINPSRVAASLAVGAYFGRSVFISGGAELPLMGKDVPVQPLFTAVLGFDFGGKDAAPKYRHSNRGFQEYYLTSRVVRVNNQLRQILIDKGSGDMIKKGELLDMFEPDGKDGTFGDTVARGRVIEVGPTKSKIQLLEYFKEEPAQEGFVVRRPVR
jgi:hypothetical protein